MTESGKIASMAKSPVNSGLLSTLLPKITGLWRQGSAFIKDLFNAFSDLVKVVIQSLLFILKLLVKQTDKSIDYLAQHPLLDKLETSFTKLKIRLRQQQSTFQHSNFYNK